MAFLSRFKRQQAPMSPGSDNEKGYIDTPVQFLTLRSGLMGVLASMGGFIFGYDTGQISGFLAMSDFLRRFSEDGKAFSNVRSGLIVGLLSIGTLAGALIIAFWTPFITAKIGFKYGYMFAGCNFAAILIVYFFVCETQGRSLEEIDTMYISHVAPWKEQ